MKIAFNNYLYESIDNLPFPPKGSIPIPSGYTRMYHQTDPAKVPSILKDGLQISKSRGKLVGDPVGIWASDNPKGFYGDSSHLDTIEFKIPTVEYNQLLGHSLIERDVPPEDILAVHSDWQNTVNYMVKNNMIDQVKNGDFDYLMNKEYEHASDYDQYTKAIQYVKSHY
ncbi:MAG: hypothetical protein M0R17_00780 [Candidatus Omnitrophica bacterium]|jgi:hypothetical protein|nr:hypothetical protein [Candidatus Omnitrophota bacterium]